MAGSVDPLRDDVVSELLGGKPNAGVAVVVGVQGPGGGRGQVADVAATQGLAGRQGTGRDPEHAKRRQRRKRSRNRGRPVPGLHEAGRVEAVPDPGVLLLVAGGQRHLYHIVLRGQLLPGGRLHVGQQRGLNRGRSAPAHDEHHGLDLHTAHQPSHHGGRLGHADGRLDGGVRHVRVRVRRAARLRAAVQLGAVSVHPVQC